MLNIYSVSEAQQTILRRDLDPGQEAGPGVMKSIERIFGQSLTPDEAVSRLLADVRNDGESAIVDWTERIDGITLQSLRVPPVEIEAALQRIPDDLRRALRISADRIRQFHERQPVPNWTTTDMGGILGQRYTPIDRVGVYVPGGAAPLPSSLLMGVIPAQVAGVPQIVVATPPGRPDGRIPDVILAAAAICGIQDLCTVGGALAVAALAYGTDTIPTVDKIVGPGNLFTTLAKRRVYGVVGIDGLYGPTETAVVADQSADPAWIASDLLAQAEHDVLASAILFTPSRPFAQAVQAEAARQMESLSRADTIAQSFNFRGGIVLVDDLAEACGLANEYAAEHTCIAVEAQFEQTCVDAIRHAGGLFIGERSFEVLGDYVAGPSHTMPTGGTARFSSPLNVLDFMKMSSIIRLDKATSSILSPLAARIALAEELTAHSAAAQKRIEVD